MRHHSDPSFRTEYQGVRRWHSADRYPDEYRNRYLPDIKTTSRYASDDPRERRYGSAQYLDYSSRRYREEFDYARKDLDRFQRYGSFKDYGNNFPDRYRTNDQYRDGTDYYNRDNKSYNEDYKYFTSNDKYRDTKDSYSKDPYRDSKDFYRDPIDPYRNSKDQYRDMKDPYRNSKDTYDGKDPYKKDHYQDLTDPYRNSKAPYRDPKDPYRDYKDAYIDPKDPYRDPYRDQKDPYRDPKDPYRNTKDTYINSQDPYRDQKDPYRSSKDPYINSKDPYMNSKDTYINGKDYCTNSKDPYINSKDPYINSKDHYINSKDPYINSKDPYLNSTDPYMRNPKDPHDNRYKDTKNMTEKQREEERIREHQRLTWRDPREAYDSNRQHHDQFLSSGYGPDDRHLNYADGSYDTHRYNDDRYYNPNTNLSYHSQQNASDPYGEYGEKPQQPKKQQSNNWYEFELSSKDRRHRSRNPPQQLNLEGRNGPASPSGGRRDRKVRQINRN